MHPRTAKSAEKCGKVRKKIKKRKTTKAAIQALSAAPKISVIS
jgi:hypothetical protein